MDESLKQYFTQDVTGNGNLRGVAGVKRCYDRTRNGKAIKQAELDSVLFIKVYSYINEFVEIIRNSNGFTDKNIQIDIIRLDNREHIVIDNRIIIRENKMFLPEGH